MKQIIILIIAIGLLSCNSNRGVSGDQDFYRSIEQLQRDFMENRFGMFICFNIMSFGAEWGEANYPIESFNPEKLDCRQWADAAVSGGMTYGLLTTKHHEGFCLWDSETTDYDIASSPYKKDIVKQFVDAFRDKKLKVGLYYSIWDSTHDIEKGKMDATKMDIVKKQLTELLTNYGKIDFMFFDGWYWQMGHREVSFSEIRELIRKLQPECLVADNTHLQGSYHNDYIMFEGPFGAYPPKDNSSASAICDLIVEGNGWFWGENSSVGECINPEKVADKIRDLESRYCTFMLATLPDREGLLDSNQVKCLREIGDLWTPDKNRKPLPPLDYRTIFPLEPVLVEASGNNGDYALDGLMNGVDYTIWTTSDEYPQYIIIDLGAKYSGVETLTCVPAHKMKPERAVKEGNITSYAVYISDDNQAYKEVENGNWLADAKTKTVTFPQSTTRYVKLEILNANGPASIAEIDIGAFNQRPFQVRKEATK